MRIVLFAIPGLMALPVLQGLLTLPVDVIGLVHPAPAGMPALTQLPVAAPARNPTLLAPATAATIADAVGIPRYAVRRDATAEIGEQLHRQQVDLVIVACWPWRIPAALLEIPRYGWLNLHPSPLPELRGPEPLFWALRLGWTRTAMTLHLMDAEFDHGPIVCQEWFDLPPGERLHSLETLAGQCAATMLPTALSQITSADWRPSPQAAGGSYFPSPRTQDFVLTAEWSVQRAYAFVRAIAEWGIPFTFIAADRQRVQIADAVEYQPHKHLAMPVVEQDGRLALQLCNGVLIGITPD